MFWVTHVKLIWIIWYYYKRKLSEAQRTYWSTIYEIEALEMWRHKYLLSRLMYRIHHRDITILDEYFIKNSNSHNYNTRQNDHNHVPSFKKIWRKTLFKYQCALIWNNVLKHEFDINASDHLFAKNIKCLILQKLIRYWLLQSLNGNCYYGIIRHTLHVATSCILNRLISRKSCVLMFISVWWLWVICNLCCNLCTPQVKNHCATYMVPINPLGFQQPLHIFMCNLCIFHPKHVYQ